MLRQSHILSKSSAIREWSNILHARGAEIDRYRVDCTTFMLQEGLPSPSMTDDTVNGVAFNSSVRQRASPFEKTPRKDGCRLDSPKSFPKSHQFYPSLVVRLMFKRSTSITRDAARGQAPKSETSAFNPMTAGQLPSGFQSGKALDVPDASSQRGFFLRLSAESP